MSKPILSILIPTTPERGLELRVLIARIHFQQVMQKGFHLKEDNITWSGFGNDEVEVIICEDRKELTLGEKRELLYNRANGIYSWQVDSDDIMPDDAIALILEATKEDSDCITFEERCYMNGNKYRSNFSLKYDDWADNFDGYDFVRTPFYKAVIKTEIAQSVPFHHIRYGEDHQWARDLKPHLKTETHIDKQLYYYIHNSTPEQFNSRYGFDRDTTNNN